MSNVLNNASLIAHEKALHAAGDAVTLVMRVPAPLKSIADQAIRAESSVSANLAEGHGWAGRNQKLNTKNSKLMPGGREEYTAPPRRLKLPVYICVDIQVWYI